MQFLPPLLSSVWNCHVMISPVALAVVHGDEEGMLLIVLCALGLRIQNNFLVEKEESCSLA